MKYTFINRAQVPLVLPREPRECGPAALAMIFAYYEKPIPWKEMLAEIIDEEGNYSAAALVRFAAGRGFETHGYRREPADLRGMEMPCLLHWNFNSFVVLEGFEGDKVYLADPACGKRECSFEQLDAGFTGVVLTVRPQNQA